MLGNYLQQTTSADVIYQMHFFLGLQGLNIHTQLPSGARGQISGWSLHTLPVFRYVSSKDCTYGQAQMSLIWFDKCTPPTSVEETGTLWRSRFYPQLDKGFPDRPDTAGFGWRLHIWQYPSPQRSATRNSPMSSIVLDIYQWPPGLCPIKYQVVCGWLHPVPTDKEPGRLSDTTRRP